MKIKTISTMANLLFLAMFSVCGTATLKSWLQFLKNLFFKIQHHRYPVIVKLVWHMKGKIWHFKVWLVKILLLYTKPAVILAMNYKLNPSHMPTKKVKKRNQLTFLVGKKSQSQNLKLNIRWCPLHLIFHHLAKAHCLSVDTPDARASSQSPKTCN